MKHKAALLLVVLLVLGLVAAIPYGQFGSVRIQDVLHVMGVAEFDSAVTMADDLTVAGDMSVTGVLSAGTVISDNLASALHVAAPTAIATATPAMVVDSLGVSNLFEVRDAATPVFAISNGGNWTASGVGTNSNQMIVSAPTAIATAQPALRVDSLGVSNLFEVRDAATPVFAVNNGGAWSASGVGTNNNQMIVSAPTSIATAQPALYADSLGVSALFEVRDAATPVFDVYNGGAVNMAGAWTAAGVGTNNNQVIVSAPTAIATAQPAFSVDSPGVSNLFEVRDAATPVVAVRNGGALWAGKGLIGSAATIACTHGAILPDFSGALVAQVTASGTPTPNDFTVGPAGTIAILIGPAASDTCTLTKGAKLALGAATRVLGANDSIILVSDGTSWNEVAFVAGATS